MEAVERDVLAAYKAECDADPEGAFAPYYHSIAKAAGNNADLAYAACKSLKKAGLLTCGSERQGSNLLNAPSYWVTDKAEAALAELPDV